MENPTRDALRMRKKREIKQLTEKPQLPTNGPETPKNKGGRPGLENPTPNTLRMRKTRDNERQAKEQRKQVLETQQELEGLFKEYNAWCEANPPDASKENRQKARAGALALTERLLDLQDKQSTVMEANEARRFKNAVARRKRSEKECEESREILAETNILHAGANRIAQLSEKLKQLTIIDEEEDGDEEEEEALIDEPTSTENKGDGANKQDDDCADKSAPPNTRYRLRSSNKTESLN